MLRNGRAEKVRASAAESMRGSLITRNAVNDLWFQEEERSGKRVQVDGIIIAVVLGGGRTTSESHASVSSSSSLHISSLTLPVVFLVIVVDAEGCAREEDKAGTGRALECDGA